MTIPLGFGRHFYLTLLAGRERRGPSRRSERANHPLDTRRNLAVLFVVSCVIGLALYGLQLSLGLWALERFVLVS